VYRIRSRLARLISGTTMTVPLNAAASMRGITRCAARMLAYSVRARRSGSPPSGRPLLRDEGERNERRRVDTGRDSEPA